MFGKLLLLFILIPLAELYLFLTLGSEIGVGNTIGIIIITAIIGATLTKSQGRRAMMKFQQATAAGRLPAREALEGLLILLAGAVLITPGFLTDAVGFLLLVPPVRTLVAIALGKRLKGRVQFFGPGMPAGPGEEEAAPRPKSKLDDGNVIDV
ncbi:MAG: FxsA family protein [Akkermansiaceae bacterium]